MPRALGARRALAPMAAVLLASSPARPAVAWGFTAHRMVTAKAIPLLPPALRPLFEANAAYVVEHAIDPDLWRGAGKAGEGPNRFLDMEAFGALPFPGLPRKEAEHLARNAGAAGEEGRAPLVPGAADR